MNNNVIGYDIVTSIIPESSRVLDLGCGTGSLMEKLITEKKLLLLVLRYLKGELVNALRKVFIAIRVTLMKDFPIIGITLLIL